MRLFTLLVPLIVCINCSFGQDSSNFTTDEHATMLQLMDSTRRADSVKRQELLDEINQLRSTDHKQRQALQDRLRKFELEDSLKVVRQKQRLEELKAVVKGFPVDPFGDTLFLIYTKVGSFSPDERARAVRGKIESLPKHFQFVPDSIKVATIEGVSEISYEGVILMSVNEMDAMWFNMTTDSLANDYRSRMVESLRREMSRDVLFNAVMRSVMVIAILLGIYFLVSLVNRIFGRIKSKVIAVKEKVLKGIRFKGYQLLDSDRELKVALYLLDGFRIFLLILLVYFMLPLLLSIFPWTRGFADALISWITTPLGHLMNGVVSYLPNLFYIAIITIVTHYIIKLFRYASGEIEREALKIPGFYPDWARPSFHIIRILLYAFMLIVVWDYLPGSGSTVFQGVSVFLGILVSLGSSSAISNGIAGLVITYMRPFKVGDRIKIGDIVGDVVEKSALVTRVRTIKNEEITIPNSSILTGHTVNYTTSALGHGLILHTEVTIGYDAPWRQVHQLLIEAAKSTQGISKDMQPFVFQTKLDDFYVEYQINAYTKEPNRMSVIYAELHQNIQDKFNEAGVEIMSPHYRALRDGNIIAVPFSYIGEDYEAPSFRIKKHPKSPT